jgi:Leucine-rich repeat (LRR) protein
VDILIAEQGLERLPEEVLRLPRIRVLDAGHNRLSEVPELPPVSDFLYLHDNRLRRVPLRNQGGLKYLNIGDNPLDPLTDEIGILQSVEELRLENSGLASLPEAIGSLRALVELALRNNALTTLPESMRALSRLTHLDLRGNRFASLPGFLSELPRLAKLDLRWNQGLALPPWIDVLRARGCRVLL